MGKLFLKSKENQRIGVFGIFERNSPFEGV